jgi:hypothetical protein
MKLVLKMDSGCTLAQIHSINTSQIQPRSRSIFTDSAKSFTSFITAESPPCLMGTKNRIIISGAMKYK